MTGRPCGGPWWLGASSGAGERQAVPVMVSHSWELLLALERGRQSLWWSLVAGSFFWHWREAGSPCDGPWWLVLHWGAVGSPGFTGTVLRGCGEPWLHWYCAGGLWGALALLVLCWGTMGSPGFAGTVLGAVGSPDFTGTVLGGCGEPWLHWYCAGGYGEPWLCWYCAGGLWGALALLVLCWGAVWSPGFTGTVLEAMGSPGYAGTVLGGQLWGALALLVLCWGLWGALASLGNLEISFWSFLSVPIVVNTVLQVYKIVCWNLFQ